MQKNLNGFHAVRRLMNEMTIGSAPRQSFLQAAHEVLGEMGGTFPRVILFALIILPN